jgi:hypothetical protein
METYSVSETESSSSMMKYFQFTLDFVKAHPLLALKIGVVLIVLACLFFSGNFVVETGAFIALLLCGVSIIILMKVSPWLRRYLTEHRPIGGRWGKFLTGIRTTCQWIYQVGLDVGIYIVAGWGITSHVGVFLFCIIYASVIRELILTLS